MNDEKYKARQARFLLKRKREGLVRVQVWVPQAYRGELVQFAQGLRKRFSVHWGGDKAKGE